MPALMTQLELWWSDGELNVHWVAAADSAAAFRLVVHVASRLASVAAIGYQVKAPWMQVAQVAESSPEMASAAMSRLWERETQLEGSVRAGASEYGISAITEGTGGQLSLLTSEGVFGSHYDRIVEIVRGHAEQQGIRIHAPLQKMVFG
jgi:hypothetical protein